MAVFTAISRSKDDLALEVSRKLIERVEERWRELIAAEPDKPLQALLDHYIHWRTVDDPGGSCVFASLIQEVSRSEGAVRATFSEGLSTLVDVLKEVVPGTTPEERRANATSTLSSMMGAVILARAVEDRALAEQFLVTMRRKLDPAAVIPKHSRNSGRKTATRFTGIAQSRKAIIAWPSTISVKVPSGDRAASSLRKAASNSSVLVTQRLWRGDGYGEGAADDILRPDYPFVDDADAFEIAEGGAQQD